MLNSINLRGDGLGDSLRKPRTQPSRDLPCVDEADFAPRQALATAPTRCSPAWSDSPQREPPWPASLPTATAAGTRPSGCPPRASCPAGAPPPARYHSETCRPPSSPASPW